MSLPGSASSAGRSRHAFLDLITSAIDEEDKQRIVHAFNEKESLLDSDVLQAYLGGQPLLVTLAVLLLLLSAAFSALAITISSCRALGKCGGKRYQPHPTSRRRFIFLLLSFLICWLLLASSALNFVIAGASFWSQRNPTQLISVPIRAPPSDYPDYDSSRLKRESILTALFNDPDYTGDFEQVEEAELTTTGAAFIQETTSRPVPIQRESTTHGRLPIRPITSLSAEEEKAPPAAEKLPSYVVTLAPAEDGEEDEEVMEEEDEEEDEDVQPQPEQQQESSFAPTRLSLPDPRLTTPAPRWVHTLGEVEEWRGVLRQNERERPFVDPQPSEQADEEEEETTLATRPLPPSTTQRTTPTTSRTPAATTSTTTTSRTPLTTRSTLPSTTQSTTTPSTTTPTTTPSTTTPSTTTSTTSRPTTALTIPRTSTIPPSTTPLPLPPLIAASTTPSTALPFFTRASPSFSLATSTLRPVSLAPFLRVAPIDTLLDEDVRVLHGISPSEASALPDFIAISAGEEAIPIPLGHFDTRQRGRGGGKTGQAAVSLLSHRRRFVSLHSPGFRLLHRFFSVLLGLLLCFCTLPSLLLVLIGAMYYARSYHPMDRSRVSDRVGLICVLIALALLFVLPLLLVHTGVGLVLSHAHHAICPLVQPSPETVEDIVMALEGCSRVQTPLVRMWQSSLLAALSSLPVALLLLQLSAYFLRMRTEHYWTQPEGSQGYIM